MVERNTRIRASQIASVLPDDLESTNSATDNQIPSYDSATQKFTWIDQAGGGGSSTSYTESFDNGDLTSSKITITHNLGVTYPIVQVYDNNDQIFLPTDITFVDTDNIELDFTGVTPITGTFNVRVVAGGSASTGKYKLTFTNSDLSSAGVLSVTHNLSEKYVQVVIYDDNDKAIVPDEITLVDTNNVDIDLSSYGVLSGNWNLIILG